MSLRRILLVVGLAFVVTLVVKIIPTGPEESEIVYTLKQMDNFRRWKFQQKALAFQAEVRDRITARVVLLSRPYVASFSRPSESSSSLVNDIVLREMPKWAHDELLRRGETEESITEEKAFALLRETPGWEEMTKLYYLLITSEQIPEAVGPDTVLPEAEAWLAELRAIALQYQVLVEDEVASATESE